MSWSVGQCFWKSSRNAGHSCGKRYSSKNRTGNESRDLFQPVSVVPLKDARLTIRRCRVVSNICGGLAVAVLQTGGVSVCDINTQARKT